MTPRRGSVVAVTLTAVTVAAMLLVIMLAARTGPHSLVHGNLRDPNFLRPVKSPPSIRPLGGLGGRGQHATARGGSFFHAVSAVVRIAILVLVLLGVGRLALWVSHTIVLRLRPKPRAEQVEFDLLEDADLVADAIREGHDDQLYLLLGGDPRNAIVACWDGFEEQAERLGVARKPWETSSEFTMRLLDAVRADPAAVSRLESLYREARFSSHEIDESRRDSAVEALEAIHRSLGARIGAR